MVTLAAITSDDELMTFIDAANAQLAALGYTEHGRRHASLVAQVAGDILRQLGSTDAQVELARIAGYLHDVGNLIHREAHALSGALIAMQGLRRLGMDDIREYLDSRLRAAGYEGPKVFSSNAIRLIGGLSRGLPRRINLLADKAMIAAALENRYQVRSREVAAAAREIKLERIRGERASKGMLSLVAGLGFAAGMVTTVSLILTALHFGWIDVQTSAPARAETITTSSASPDRIAR